MRNFFIWAMLISLLMPLSIQAAEDALTNIERPSQPSAIAPGAVILMPDGGQGVILSTLPNGDLLTDLGISISPQGIIRDGEFKGQSARLDPELLPARETDVAVLPDIVQPKATIPGKQATLPKTPEAPAQARATEKPAIKAELPKAESPRTVNPPEKMTPEEERALSLAQMLPLTRIQDEKKNIHPAQVEKSGARTGQLAEEKKTPGPDEQQKSKTQAKGPQPEKAQKAETKPKQVKAKPGEPLRIPPEAAKTGNLSFLEGCWQGTRPEYYSKRIIRECFCFGANGSSGKRRIFDGPKRMCIGSSKAHLSSTGVLSVTSNGAACNDGERWGSAEMVCRNSGPHTPCSWVFSDANNGRQSYEIPFVRVESCGR